MNIYLFELDSVRNSKKEIEIGQQTLFEEIVKNGNTVILSFNQFADSVAFLSSIRNEKIYPSILSLFKFGSIKISKYKIGESIIGTPSQYIQRGIEKCIKEGNDAFLFSSIPVKIEEEALLNFILNALRFSDPFILKDLLEKKTEMLNSLSLDETTNEYKNILNDVKRLEYIYRYVKLILEISAMEIAMHPPKISEKIFTDYLDKVFSFIHDQRPTSFKNILEQKGLYQTFNDAVSLLESLKVKMQNENKEENYLQNRSNWVLQWNELESCELHSMAEAIVDLCYNYVVEDSISEVSKHYTKLEAENFQNEFANRLIEYWESQISRDHKFMKGDRIEVVEYDELEMPPWRKATRLLDMNPITLFLMKNIKWIMKLVMKTTSTNNEQTYNSGFQINKRLWKLQLCINFMSKILSAIIFIVLFLLVNNSNKFIQNFIEIVFNLSINIKSNDFSYDMFIGVLVAMATSIISKLLKIPDILDTVFVFFRSICDYIIVILNNRNISYKNGSKGYKSEK